MLQLQKCMLSAAANKGHKITYTITFCKNGIPDHEI